MGWRLYRALVELLYCGERHITRPFLIWAMCYRSRHALERACVSRTCRTIDGQVLGYQPVVPDTDWTRVRRPGGTAARREP